MRLHRGPLGAVAALCLLAPLAPTMLWQPATGAEAGTAAAEDSTFSVATYNIRHALSDSVAVADIEKLADAGADVISLQEMGSAQRRDAVRARMINCVTCEFGAAMPNGAGPGEIPILFRRAEFQYLGKGIEKISDATYVGPDGAGPSTIGPKYLNYVELQHRATGQVVYVVNNHTVPSVQASDGGPNYDHPERLDLYRQHMSSLRGMVSRLAAETPGAEVLATGDLNVNYRSDSVRQDAIFPYANMKRVDMFASYRSLGKPAIGTQINRNGNDTRLIDYVAATTNPTFTPTGQKILTGYESDHRPLVVTFGVVGAPGSPTDVTAEPLERSARVSWAPAPANGTPVTEYTVTAVQSGAQVTVSGDARAATVPGLSVGENYSFVVSATSRVGTGPASVESAGVTPYAVPPRTTIVGGPADGAFVTSSSALFRYASDVAGSSFACTIDGEGRSCGTGSIELDSLKEGTHRFEVAATDPDGDVDATPAGRSWTVPLDARRLARTDNWSLRYGQRYYTGAYAQATRHGAVLSRKVTGARSLALVATTGPEHGTVRVYLDSTLLKRIPLSSSTLRRTRVLPIAHLYEPVTGKVRVVVASSGRTVRIEGLGVGHG